MERGRLRPGQGRRHALPSLAKRVYSMKAITCSKGWLLGKAILSFNHIQYLYTFFKSGSGSQVMPSHANSCSIKFKSKPTPHICQWLSAAPSNPFSTRRRSIFGDLWPQPPAIGDLRKPHMKLASVDLSQTWLGRQSHRCHPMAQ